VTARWIFYNNSWFDRAPNGDDGAIAYDKVALAPNCKATFDNLTSYSRGINGIMVDLTGVRDPAAVSVDDFQFRTRSVSGDWLPLATLPSVSYRPLAGDARFVLTWPDGTIRNTWLEVTMLATADTNLPCDDIFYFGNLIGEAVSTSDSMATVDSSDRTALTSSYNQRGVAIDHIADFDRSGVISLSDRVAQSAFLGASLPLITAPAIQGKAEPTATQQLSPDLLTQLARATARPAPASPTEPANRSAVVDLVLAGLADTGPAPRPVARASR
jgi:hypothetical protein